MKRRSIKEVAKNPRENEYYILVSRWNIARYYGSFDELGIEYWDRDLAPSEELLEDWKNDRISWEEYRERFVEDKTEILIERKKEIYEEMTNGKEPVLVCKEEKEEYPKCHTWIILEIMEGE